MTKVMCPDCGVKMQRLRIMVKTANMKQAAMTTVQNCRKCGHKFLQKDKVKELERWNGYASDERKETVSQVQSYTQTS